MNKKLLIYSTLLLSMTACSVDEIDAPSGLSPDGELTVNLAVPQMQTVATRVDTTTISNVTMLAVHDGTVKQKVDFKTADLTPTDNGYSVRTKINDDIRSKNNVSLYFLANLPSTITFAENLSEEDLKKMTYTSILEGGNMTMSGLTTLSDVAKGNSVSVNRNGVLVTVTDGKQNGDKWEPGDNSYPFQVFGTASESRIVAATINDQRLLPDAKEENPTSLTNTEKEMYVHPTRNDGRDVAARPYMIIKADYESKAYYYRVEFETYDDATKKINTLSLVPNHHYQVIVTKVKDRGDLTVEDAVKNPTSLLEITINDYSPRAYNLITDGTRELGVSHEIFYNGEHADGVASLYVKVYSPDATEYPMQAADIKNGLKSSKGWLTFGTPVEVTDRNEIGKYQGTGNDFDGKLYKVPLNFKQTSIPGELDATVTLTWKGLSRNVPVKWTRIFNGSDLCSASLTIRDTSTQRADITDYWTFLKTCHGVGFDKNNEKHVRDEGLHFPINYGGIDARWTYTYNLSFKNLNNGNAYDWKITHEGVSGIQVNQTSGTNVTGNTDVSITRTSSGDDWQYEEGTLTFSISSPGQNEWTDYTIDLYHTGFFDNPVLFRNHPTNRRVGAVDQNEYYYYEVIAGPSGKYYWLDRNLGATSASYYIRTADGDTYYGDSDAAGGYYRAAKYNEDKGDPIMYDDLCPPGYEIPRVDVWNTLRNSPNFTTRQSGTRFLTEFTNEAGQTVYFPRCLFYNQSDVQTGESRAGYYWSSTAAEGLEKNQIGNWLRYLKFSGNIASYDNAEVEGRKGSKGVAMSVRCVNKTVFDNTVYRTHFNVAGATHVFLYSLDADGNYNAVTNWPGKAIGNYLTMADPNQLFNFVYESPNTKPEQFYVMFTFRDEDGLWHTMSKGQNGQTVYSNDKRYQELQGWKVTGENWKSVTTALGGTWKCTYNKTTGTADVTFIRP